MSQFRASSRTAIDAFQAMAVLDKANAMEANGETVSHLEVGQPGTGAPPSAINAVKNAVDQKVMGYTSAFGMPGLREKLAAFYQVRYGATVDPRCIAITNGSSAGFVLSFLASFEPGARVALTAPGYPAYRNILVALGYEPVLIEVNEDTRFQPTIEMLSALAPLDGLILASPGNPTGTMVSPQEFATIYQWCEGNGCRLISDEIYHGLTWGQPETTAAGKPGHAIVINSFSKYFSMTGWRVGWLILPEDLVDAVERLAQNLFICAPAISQIAAEGALDDLDHLDTLRDAYRAKSDIVQQALASMGLRGSPSDGAFYAYPNISALSNSATDFAQRALDEAGVAIVPGLDFDPINGNSYVRIGFAGSEETVKRGTQSLVDWVRSSFS